MKIEKTGWYKVEFNKFIAYFDLEKGIAYGFDTIGDWFSLESFTLSEFTHIEPATEQEATERLKAEAIERGYVEGAEVVSLYSLLLETIEGIDYVFGNAGFFAGSTVIMKDGEWAEITKHAEQPQEKTFPRMMEVKQDESFDHYCERTIEIIWNGKAWSYDGTQKDVLIAWEVYREIESNEKADKIAEIQKLK